jgi:hypothetical protein
MITIFYTVVLSTDPGNGTVTQEFCLLIRQGATASHAIRLQNLKVFSIFKT